MKKLSLTFLSIGQLWLSSCNNETKPLNENTFVYGHKVYKVVDNEVREIADLSGDIKKINVSKTTLKDLGKCSLGFVKPGAFSQLQTLYRGNNLYYKFQVDSLNDLKENYYGYGFTIELRDKYGFILNTIPVSLTDLSGFIDHDGKVHEYECKGKLEMSSEIAEGISQFNINATLVKRP